MREAFILCLIVILLTLAIYFLFFKKHKNLKFNIFFAFVSCIVSISILVFPLLDFENIYLKILGSIMYAMKCAGMGQEIGILSKIDFGTMYGYAYFIVIIILFLAAPLLTVSFIIAYFEKLTTYIKLAFSKNKKLYIFSDVNDKSLTIAKNIIKRKSGTVVFANTKEKLDINIKSVKISKEITDVHINSKNDIIFYMISENEEKNLNDTLKLIDKYKNRDKTKIYVINKSEEAPIILDSMDKGKVVVDVINEKERAIFNLLNDKPLFLNTIDNTISLLIVGCGNIGKEFLKDSVWCAMMPDYKLKILIIDVNADKIKDNISVEMPELLDNYDITFLNADIKSNISMKELKSKKDINYILVATGNEDKNVDISIMLRRFFLREFNREPIINLYVENEYKQKQISTLVNEKGYSYDLNAFGNIHYLYKKNSIIDSELERLAIQVHLSYDPEDVELHRYNLREYNKRSSRASALHIKYKLYSVLKDKFTDDMKENLKLFRNIYSPKIEKILIKNEHDRWMAYTRSIGYVYASLDEVAKYYQKNKHYIHYLARMHPALVEFNELDNVSKKLSKITSKKINFVDSDKKIIKNIYEKVEL